MKKIFKFMVNMTSVPNIVLIIMFTIMGAFFTVNAINKTKLDAAYKQLSTIENITNPLINNTILIYERLDSIALKIDGLNNKKNGKRN